MTQRKRRDRWTTYATRPYTSQEGSDPRATGDRQYLQVRRCPDDRWYRRVADGNGPYVSAGQPTAIDADEGKRLYRRAK